MYDGVDNGPSAPPPVNDMVKYLTDGTNGLDLGTGVANLPAGTLSFNISNINPLAIGDGIPDILITQIADPSAGVDKYEFTTDADATVGNLINISFSGINAVANWVADFYEASKNPPTLTSSFTKSARPVRLWAADFSFFGITSLNYSNIKKFLIHLNGNSDIAFIAYNNASAFITLSVDYTFFTSGVENNSVILRWQTESENNSDRFVIEESLDGKSFRDVGIVLATGNSTVPVNYKFELNNVAGGLHYFRLKQIDRDGRTYHSKIIKQSVAANTLLTVSPNPATTTVVVSHPSGMKGDGINIYAIDGKWVASENIAVGATSSKLRLQTFPAGRYILQWTDRNGKSLTTTLIKK